MKYLAALLILAAPFHALAQSAPPAQTEQKSTEGQAKPKQKPVSQINEPKKKSSVGAVRVNPVEYDPATGKHCSGQGAYRVCW